MYLSSLSGDWLPVAKHVFAVPVPVVWNPGAEQIKAGYATIAPFLKKTALLIVNKDEAIELVLTGIKVGRKNHSYLNKPAYLLNVLKEWCPGIVMVTDGHRGAYAHDGAKLYFEKARKVTVHDTTGVGDAFAAGVVAGLYDLRLSVQQALLCGIVNSASVATKVGAQEGLLNRSSLQSKLL